MPIENIWTAGGIVSYSLLAFSVIAVALIVERIIFWLRIKRRQRRIVKEILSIYRSDPLSAIAKLKKNAQFL